MTKKVVCGLLSTTVQQPNTLPNSDGLDFYKMTYPDDLYEIDQFVSSHVVCDITNLTIVPIESGASDDYTISDVEP